MFTDQIDKLKNQYTDKYVVVDGSRPELARFRDITGQVKTVNMSGRALVEFQDYHLNIGWFDIAPEFLKVIDKPLPKVEKPKSEKKPAAAKAEAKPAAASKPQAAGSPAVPGKMSVSDMLAAARGGAAPASAKSAEAKPKAEAAKPKPTPAPAASSAPAKVDRSKMSVADMLAAARADKAGAAAPAAKLPAEVEPEAAESAPVDEVDDAPVAKSPAVAAPTEAGIVKIDRSTMSIADMLAYARKSDGQG